MRQALTEQVHDPVLRAWVLRTFADMADHMVNVDGGSACSAALASQSSATSAITH
jgi:hypothetical protein